MGHISTVKIGDKWIDLYDVFNSPHAPGLITPIHTEQEHKAIDSAKEQL